MFLSLRLLRPLILALCCLVISSSGMAAKKKPQTFDAWLEKYHAWDIYEQELSTQPTTEQNVLSRAASLLRLEKPAQVMDLLRKPFADPAHENQRLILRARAQRLQGLYEECVFSWMAFARTVSLKISTSVLSNEPGLDLLFENVWKKWFWESFFTSNARLYDSRQPLMTKMLDLGGSVWPKEIFWKQIQPIYVDPSTFFLPSALSETPVSRERDLTGKALAYWSLGFWDKGDRLINDLSNREHARFWHHFSALLGRPEPFEHPVMAPGHHHSTSQAFFTLFSPDIRSTGTWLLTPPDTPSWSTFAEQIKNMEPDRALSMIQQEQGSMFLSDPVRKSLVVCQVAFKLQHTSVRDLDADWKTLDTDTGNPPPLLLSLAYMILGGHSAMPSNFQTSALLTYLTRAVGMDTSRGVLAPFWDTALSDGQYPLDYLLEYVALAREMQKSPTHEASIDLAFLFPQSPAAQKGLLFLAGEAHGLGEKKQSWAYLQKIRTKDLDSNDRIDFLLARAGMEIELGYEDAALKDYATLLQETPERIPPEKQLKLALLGQQKRQWEWAQGILEGLWKKRALVDENIRAEILFWLGEGAQSQGKMKEALEYYLRLAWNYPRQNIWAVTAMYRAGLMYEKNGQFETARRLYTTVLKNSDRESQKKAAKARIASVSAGLEQQKSKEPLPLF